MIDIAKNPGNTIFDPENMPKDIRQVLQIQDLIEQNYQSQRKPQYYCKMLGLPLERMNFLSKTYLGHTVYELVQQRLHAEVEKLLKYSTLTVKDIGNIMGCCDPQYLSRCFKQRSGLSPLEYREKYKNHDLKRIFNA